MGLRLGRTGGIGFVAAAASLAILLPPLSAAPASR